MRCGRGGWIHREEGDSRMTRAIKAIKKGRIQDGRKAKKKGRSREKRKERKSGRRRKSGRELYVILRLKGTLKRELTFLLLCLLC